MDRRGLLRLLQLLWPHDEPGFRLGRRTGEISRILDNSLSALREFLFDAVFLILPFTAPAAARSRT